MREKKLYKSADKKVCGVCGGIAEYFGIDPTVVRLVYVILVMFSGIGILPYIIAAIIMDDAPGSERSYNDNVVEPSYSSDDVYESSEPVGFKPGSDDSEIKGFNPGSDNR